MCARRFLILILILTLIFVGGAFALYQWGSNILLQSATPRGHYQEPPKSSGPDYGKLDNWVSWPDPHGSPAQWLPVDVDWPSDPNAPRIATFYIHPTTYLQRDHWNAPLDDAESQQKSVLFAQSQASAFDGISSVWAPKYRQAAYGAFLLKSEDAQKALDLAYRDVLAAFDNFLSRIPAEEPVILAAHSQGSMHLLRLLGDRKNELKGRLVAAYVVGWPVGVKSDLPATGLQACASPDQIGCLLSWQSFKEPDNTNMITDAWVGTTGLTGSKRAREEMICTNPLTGTKDGAAPPSANRGTLLPNGDLSSATLATGRVGARCDEGFLLIDGDVPNLGPYVLPGNNYHVYDYALFWGSIRTDAERRVAAWRNR